jgi:predicted NBD/HSP70 family sugar kinase
VTGTPTSRDHNKASVLDVVLAQAPLTRNMLIELTGLSKATVSRAVEELRADGFVVDGGLDAVNGRGRRSTYLDVPAAAGHVAGIGLGAQTTCVLVTDLRGREVGHVVASTPNDDDVGRVAAWLVALVAETTASAKGPLRQIVVAVPGRVRNGTEIHGPSDSRELFRGAGLHRALRDLVDAPVSLDSDANASLLEILTEDASVGDAALFLVSTALSFATCAGHEIARGRTPSFGNVGMLHSGVEHQTLDGLLSTTGLRKFAEEQGLRLERVEDVCSESLDEPKRTEVLEAVTTAAVTAVTAVAVTLDPESVYFAGRLRPVLETVLPEVRSRLADSLPSVPEIRVVTQVIGLSVARGAARAGLTATHDRLRDAVLEARRQTRPGPQAAPAF